MKSISIIIFLLLQQPFDITPYIQDMDDGWSIGNGCDEPFTEWVSTTSIETNGHVLEVMNSHVAINGFIYENDQVQDVIEMIASGKVLLSCLDSMISVDSTLSINDQEQDLQVTKVFPNPFDSHVTIKGFDIKKIYLYDITAKVILQEDNIQDETYLNLQFLNSGIYFLRVEFNSRTPETVRIIKK